MFPFGSDPLGRDLLSLVLAGAGTTLTIVVVAGMARVAAGVLVAAAGYRFPALRALTEPAAELMSAVPATLAALLLIKAFVGTEVDLVAFVAALLALGWAGPYRVMRAELDRVSRSPFAEGAKALGMSTWRSFWRHQLPHLMPTIAVNGSQQVIASLVLVAELGVLGTAVGVTRVVSLEASVSRVLPGQVDVARVPDLAEWGALLSASRTAEALWVTRWLILLPGLAFALSAAAVAIIGLALAGRYARHDVIADVTGRGVRAIALAVLAIFIASALIPERYAAAREWADAARAEIGPTADADRAFADAGLRPVADGFALHRDTSSVLQTGPATVRVGELELTETWPRPTLAGSDPSRRMRSFVTGSTGGGIVEARLVFAARGISTGDHQPRPQQIGANRVPDWAQLIRNYNYADDYAAIDVRGKVVLLVRALGIRGPTANEQLRGYALGPIAQRSIQIAIDRGAAAVLFVDPALWLYTDVPTSFTVFQGELMGGVSPYVRAERASPPVSASGVPVVILGEAAAKELVRPFGIDVDPLLGFDDRNDPRHRVSAARDLGVTARIAVPLKLRSASTTSYLGEVSGAPEDAARVLVWGIRKPDTQASVEVVSAVGRALSDRQVPFILVSFDPTVDAAANARFVRQALGDRTIGLVLVVNDLEGSALRFTTPNGELIQALDLYAKRTGAPFRPTLETARPADLVGLAPFPDVRTVVLGADGEQGDLRGEVAALIGYIAGRWALGAPELPR